MLRTLRQSPESSPFWQRIIRELAIGETFFLREHRHYKVLREHVLPELIRRKQQTDDRMLRIWCAGCSTGEEAYSVAITLLQTIPAAHEWQLRILATDINAEAIQRAQQGIYREWSFRQVPPGFRERYFRMEDDGARINSEIREMVTFQRHNLLSGAAQMLSDLIICRNVLMYFGKEQKTQAEDLLYAGLLPGGWLFLGQAEAILGQRERWITHIFPGAPIYQKPETPKRTPETIRHRALSPTQPLTPAVQEQVNAYHSAVDAARQERFAEAELTLSQLLAEHPQHAKGHTLLASLFANQQAYPEAQAHLDTALYYDPLLADAHYLRALIALEQQQPQDAAEALRRARFCQPDHLLAGFTLGMVYAQMGEPAKATATWESVLAQAQAAPSDNLICDVSSITVRKVRTLLEIRVGDDNGLTDQAE